MTPAWISRTAIAILLASGSAATAEQYAIEMLVPAGGASEGLLHSLDVREVDSTRYGNRHFLIVEARDEGFVEAYALARSIDAKGLYTLVADWDGYAMSTLTVAQREAFFSKTPCGFCTQWPVERPDE